MERVYVFILRNDVWIYILVVLGLFWYGSQYLQARRKLQQAMFGLERERGSQMRNTAIFFLLFFFGLGGIVYYVNTSIAPTLPASLLKPPTPTPNIFATPLSSPTPLGTAEIRPPEPTPALVPTITLASQPGGLTVSEAEATARPNAPPTPSGPTPTPFVDCTVNLNIREPANGSVVSGLINFTGTAATPNFGFYKLEANGPETAGSWASLLGRTVDRPVRDGFLGNVNLSEWSGGPYLLRLTAVDINGSETGQCVIQVTLDNQ
ncbi:MAG: hypothetical protein IPM39_08265 [Chloroflexi bacterium]|nr:hypothetical protein [Chloroflexota bacterium]